MGNGMERVRRRQATARTVGAMRKDPGAEYEKESKAVCAIMALPALLSVHEVVHEGDEE